MVLINQFINFKIGGVTIIATSTELNYNSGTIPGSVIAGKTVVVDSNNNIIGFNTVEADNLTGLITTPAQPSITSLGTIVNLLSSGTNIHGISGSGILRTTINNNNIYLQPGLSNSSNSSTNLFITNTQQDITNSSKIFSIMVDGKVGIQSSNPSKQLEINSSNGNNLRLTYNNNSGTATTFSDFSTGSTGHLVITTSGDLTQITKKLQVNDVILNFNTGGLLIKSISTNNNIGRVINTEIINTLNITNYNTGSITNNFSLEIIGYIRPLYTDTYTFFIGWDNDIRFFLNGELLLNKVGVGSGTNISAITISLVADIWYPIFIQNSKTLGTQLIQVEWSSTSQTREFIPSDRMAWDNKEPSVQMKSNIGDKLTLFNLTTNTLPSIVSLNCTSNGNLNIIPTNKFVGINKSVPTSILHLFSNETNNDTINVENITTTGYASVNHISNLVNWSSGARSSLNSSAPNSYFINGGSSPSLKFVINSDGNIGINTVKADRKLEINDTAGNCLRLTFNDADGSATTYSDFLMKNTGSLEITTSSGLLKLLSPGVNNELNISSSTVLLNLDSTLNTSSSDIQFNTSGNDWLLTGRGSSNSTNPNTFSIYDNTNALYRLILDTSGNINIVAHNSSTIGLRLGGTLITSSATEINYLDLTTGPGTAQASKALVLDSSSNITGINSLTATSLIGAVSTPVQPSITSLGTLSSLNVSGVVIMGLISEGNPRIRVAIHSTTLYLQTGISTTTGSKCDLFIGNIGEQATLSTRKFIYKADGKIGIGTILPTQQLDINSSTGDCLRLIYNDTDGSATNFADFLVSSGGDLTITPSGGDTTITGNLATTISTPAQPNITSLGTLTTLRTSGNVGINTTTPGRQLEVNSATGNCLRLTYNDADGGATKYTDMILAADGTLYIQPISNAMVLDGRVFIDANGTDALKITKNANGGDVFRVDTTNSIITLTGNLTLAGTGALSGVTTLSASGMVTFSAEVASTTTATGTLVVSGGVGVSGALNATSLGGTLTTVAQPAITSVGTLTSLTVSGATILTANTASTTTATGALVITGGLGVGGAINATSFTGSILTPAQTSITSIGTLTSLTVSGATILTANTASTTTATGALVITGGLGVGGAINATSFTGSIMTASQTAITSVGTLSSLTVSGSTILTANTASTTIATGALIVTGGVGVGGALNATSLGGAVTTAAQTAITSIGTLTSLNVSGTTNMGDLTGATGRIRFIAAGATMYIQSGTTASAGSPVDLFFGDMSTAPTASTKKIMFKASGRVGIDTVNPTRQLEVNSVTGDCLRLTYNDNDGSAVNYTDLLVSSSGDLTIIPTGGDANITGNLSVTGSLNAGSFTVAELSATILTPSQPNITSVGTLSSLRTGSSVVGINTTTPGRQLEINSSTGDCLRLTYNDSDGSAVNFTDFLLSSGGDLTISPSGGDTTITGNLATTISTSAQPNITSIGTLTSLRTSGNVGINTTTPTRQLEINNSTGECLRLTYNDSDGGATNFADFLISSGGDLTITPSGGDTTITGNLATTISTAAQPNITSVGTLSSLNISGATSTNTTTGALIVTGGIGVSGSLNATLLGGTLTTAAQNAITSLGTLTSLSVSGAASTTTTTGALIVTGGIGVSGTLNATSLGGTLTTAAQTAITSVGTLSSLRTGSTAVGINTTTPGMQMEINSSTGNCLRLTYNDDNGSATFYTDFLVAPDGSFYITPSGANMNIASNININNKKLGIGNNLGIFRKQLEVNSSTGDCLRLSYNDPTGVSTNYADLLVSSSGDLTITPFGGDTTITGTLTTTGTVKINTSSINTLACESSNANVLTNSSVISDFDVYIKKNLIADGGTSGIAFSQTSNSPSSTLPSASIIVTRVSAFVSSMSFNTSQGERFKIGETGICNFRSSTASTSSTVGALLLTGGLSLANTTEATSATNGGTITTAGGVAIAKKLFVGGAVNISDNTISSSSGSGALTIGGGLGVVGALNVSGTIRFSNSTVSTSSSTGAVVISGGLGIGGAINVGGTRSAASWLTSGIQYNSVASTYTNSSAAATYASAVITSFAQPTIAASFASTIVTRAATLYIDNAPVAGTNMTLTNSNSLWIPNGNVLFGASTVSTTSTNGALVVTGGLGIGGAINVGGGLSAHGTTLLGNMAGSHIRISESGNVVFIQPGLSTTPGSAADLFIGNYLQTTAGSARKIMFKSDGTVGIGTSLPSKQLEINSATGDCLRLTYNDGDGSATNYSDLLVSATGELTITPTGDNTIINSKLQVNKAISNFNTGGLIVNSISSSANNPGRLVNKNITTTLNISNYNPASLVDFYNLEIIGYIQPLYSETYTFYIGWDDTIRVFINNELIFNRYGGTIGTDTATNTIALTANIWYPIFIQNTEETIGQLIQVQWQSASQAKEYIPANRMSWDNKESNITRKPFAGDRLTIFSLATVNTISTVSLDCSSTGDLTITPSGGDTTITGNLATTISTPAQPNITSVGTLTSLSVSGATSLSTLRTTGSVGIGMASPTQLLDIQNLATDNYIRIGAGDTNTKSSGILLTERDLDYGWHIIHNAGSDNLTIGYQSTLPTFTTLLNFRRTLNSIEMPANVASSSTTTGALVITGGLGVGGAINATSFTGSILTASQPNITSVGTLIGLRTNNTSVGINTTTPARQLEINSSTGNCLRLTYNDADGSATNYSDLTIAPDGTLYLQPSNSNVVIDGSTFIDRTSTTAFVVRKDGGGNVFIVDSTNNMVGINTQPSAALHIKQVADDVSGDISSYNQVGIIIERAGNTDKWSIGQNTGSSLSFYFGLVTKGYISSANSNVLMNFTGQHRSSTNNTDINNNIEKYVGLIVYSTGVYNNLNSEAIEINEALPKVELTNTYQDKRVFGVISNREDENSNRTYTQGVFVSVFEKNEGDERLIINSVGEGMVWICDKNGPIENGDLIVSAGVSGYGTKQETIFVCNYTVGKITQDCDFSTPDRYTDLLGNVVSKSVYDSNPSNHAKCNFVGCVYYCG